MGKRAKKKKNIEPIWLTKFTRGARGFLWNTTDKVPTEGREHGELRGPPSSSEAVTQFASDETINDNISISGSTVQWDMWSFHVRVDKRPGLILSDIKVDFHGEVHEILYSLVLSEVFVPYMDGDESWYFRTYMDSGEYGFGSSMSPLRPGLDCPEDARFMEIVLHGDDGMPYTMPGAYCIFERAIGNPQWRHYEFGEDKPASGRAAKDLVVRYASTVGNYDYLIDYIFLPDGNIKVAVGATGIDAPKGSNAATMKDPTAAVETEVGTLIAPNIIGAFHSHFFNFRMDFDVQGEANEFHKVHLVQKNNTVGTPRLSLRGVEYETIETETAASTKIDPYNPSQYYIVNPNVEGALGHNPGYGVMPGASWTPTLLSPEDIPVLRNAYINNQIWVTPYDPDQIWAGGEYAMQSDGSDTLATWVEADRSIANTDIVMWYSMGFHHVTKQEDWPVMSTTWFDFKITPFNFFPHNPSLTLAAETVPAKVCSSGSSEVVEGEEEETSTAETSEPEASGALKQIWQVSVVCLVAGALLSL